MKPEQNPYARPLAPIVDPTSFDEKGPRDLEVVTGAIRSMSEYQCVLTGRPARVIPVDLRRMIITPVGWMGYKARIVLPLSRHPFLVFWQLAICQYVRMLRPWATFAIFFHLMHVITDERDRWGSPLGNLTPRQIMIVGGAVPFGSAVMLWLGLGKLMNCFEFVRLLYFNRTDGLVKIRFSKPGLARRASEILIFPKPPIS